jgi:hypothetical protein
MKRLLACWFDRLRAWGRQLTRRRDQPAGTLWLRLAPRPAIADDLPPWARPVEALAHQARQEGEAAVARLAGRLPAGISALGEWRGDNGDALRVLAARHGWPETGGRREVNHWLWLARGGHAADSALHDTSPAAIGGWSAPLPPPLSRRERGRG